MRRHAKASSARVKSRKPSGHGASIASGRLRYVILAAAVAAFLSVPASQAAAAPTTVKVNVAGSGSGEVTSHPGAPGKPALACSYVSPGPATGICENVMTDPNKTGTEEEVILLAAPAAGSVFGGWTVQKGTVYEGCEAFFPCWLYEEPLEAGAADEVTAVFNQATPLRTLATTSAGAGSGEVKCKFNGGPAGACTSPQGNGTEVEVVATASPGSVFTGFSAGSGSASSCTTSPCAFTIGADSAVTATFNIATPLRTLATTNAGSGSGEVKCKFNVGPAGACTSPQGNGTEVEVIATASPGSTFAGFSAGSGSASSCTTSPCAFTIEADSAVTATFNAIPPPPSPTCATDPSLCPPPPPPPPPAEGQAKASGSATVSAGKAALKLTCSGGPCKGTLQLTAKVRQGKKAKSLVIGKASFSLADGASTTLKVKLSGPAKQELAKGKALKAKLAGTGIAASAVMLKPAKK